MRRDAAGGGGSSAVWSRRRDEITFDRLDKFWHDLSPQARRDLLKLDKQTLTEHARKNSYCSRCYGLLLDCFARIAVYGKSLRQGASNVAHLSWATSDGHGPSVHPCWGGLSTTKDGILTLLDCFVKANSLTALQNVFDDALARERERKMRYPYACSAGGRGCGTREMCALHTARPSCDTLEDFWSPLDEETRSSLLRMREEDFIEKLTRRFDKKKFCRDCRKNVIREFKELKEPKRVPRERRCNCWFCVENGFQCEVFDDGIIVDWSQCLSEAQGTFHRFEWAVGTQEGESDISGFEDVGMNARVHKTGIDLVQFENYFITLRAWRSDDRCTEYCVKAHVLKGKSSCVHLQHALVVGDGYVTITNGGSMKGFFERAEKVEEEDEHADMNKDGNDLDANGSHTQKHAKSPELAREFLLDAASVIFKEQVVKAYRDDTAQQNATIVFVSLALKLLEERVHVACKELIILEKQKKLLEEEEKEMREEKQRRMKRGMKEKEKKHKQKQRLKGKGKGKGAKLVESKPPNDMPSPTLNNSSTCTNHESTDTACSRDSANAEVMDLYSPGRAIDQTSCRENKADHCNGVTEMSPTDSSGCCCTSEQSGSQDEPGTIGDSQWQSIERKRRSGRSCSFIYPKGGHIGSAQKNAIPKQAWERVDARKKTSLYSTDNAVGNVNRLKPLDWDASGYRACENCERGQAASGGRNHMVNNKKDCYSTQDETFWHDEDRMTNSDRSSTLSSCIDGDRESSSSSVTVSSEQNLESSLTDEPERCPDRTDSNMDTPPSRTASQSLLETCGRKGFREYRPEATRLTHDGGIGFNAHFQDQQLHHQSMHSHPNPSPAMRRHSHCWASPTNQNFQYVNCRARYSNVNPYLAHQQQQCHMHPELIQKTGASFRTMPPSPSCQNRGMDLERNPSDKMEPLGEKDLPEDNDKGTADASFSLFQFSLPIASPSPPLLSGEFAGRIPLAQVQAQLCSREQTDVKEYKLFSTKDSGAFSFMQIK